MAKAIVKNSFASFFPQEANGSPREEIPAAGKKQGTSKEPSFGLRSSNLPTGLIAPILPFMPAVPLSPVSVGWISGEANTGREVPATGPPACAWTAASEDLSEDPGTALLTQEVPEIPSGTWQEMEANRIPDLVSPGDHDQHDRPPVDPGPTLPAAYDSLLTPTEQKEPRARQTLDQDEVTAGTSLSRQMPQHSVELMVPLVPVHAEAHQAPRSSVAPNLKNTGASTFGSVEKESTSTDRLNTSQAASGKQKTDATVQVQPVLISLGSLPVFVETSLGNVSVSTSTAPDQAASAAAEFSAATTPSSGAAPLGSSGRATTHWLQKVADPQQGQGLPFLAQDGFQSSAIHPLLYRAETGHASSGGNQANTATEAMPASEEAREIFPAMARPDVGQLLRSAVSSEMRVRLDAQEFGNVSIHATLKRSGVAAEINVTDAALASAISSQVATSTVKAGQHENLRTSVLVQAHAGSSSTNQQGGQHSPDRRRPPPAVVPPMTPVSESAAPWQVPLNASIPVGSGNRLDVHI